MSLTDEELVAIRLNNSKIECSRLQHLLMVGQNDPGNGCRTKSGAKTTFYTEGSIMVDDSKVLQDNEEPVRKKVRIRFNVSATSGTHKEGNMKTLTKTFWGPDSIYIEHPPTEATMCEALPRLDQMLEAFFDMVGEFKDQTPIELIDISDEALDQFIG